MGRIGGPDGVDPSGACWGSIGGQFGSVWGHFGVSGRFWEFPVSALFPPEFGKNRYRQTSILGPSFLGHFRPNSA